MSLRSATMTTEQREAASTSIKTPSNDKNKQRNAGNDAKMRLMTTSNSARYVDNLCKEAEHG
jgi:hypothetical protein